MCKCLQDFFCHFAHVAVRKFACDSIKSFVTKACLGRRKRAAERTELLLGAPFKQAMSITIYLYLLVHSLAHHNALLFFTQFNQAAIQPNV